jgi:LPS sulfotransferase NodH
MNSPITPEHRTFDTFLARVRQMATTENGVLCIKVHWHHLTSALNLLRIAATPSEVALQVLAEWFPNPRYVLLSRRNKLRQAISYYRAIRTDAWSSLHHAVNSIETSTIALDEIERLRVELDCADLSWPHSDQSVPVHCVYGTRISLSSPKLPYMQFFAN